MKIINVKEASALLGVKEKTVYQWAEQRQIPHFKINGALRFDMEEVQSWLLTFKKEPLLCYNSATKMEARIGGKVNNEPRKKR